MLFFRIIFIFIFFVSCTSVSLRADEDDEDSTNSSSKEEDTNDDDNEKKTGKHNKKKPEEEKDTEDEKDSDGEKKNKKNKFGKFGKKNLKDMVSKTGGGKNIPQQLTQFLLSFPNEIQSFISSLEKISASITQTRMIVADPNVNVPILANLNTTLAQSLQTLQMQVGSFQTIPPIMGLKKINDLCSSPEAMLAMGIPEVGQVVVGLCAKIATIQTKVDVLQMRAEAALNSALTAKENLYQKLMSLPGGQAALMVMAQNSQNMIAGAGMAVASGMPFAANGNLGTTLSGSLGNALGANLAAMAQQKAMNNLNAALPGMATASPGQPVMLPSAQGALFSGIGGQINPQEFTPQGQQSLPAS